MCESQPWGQTVVIVIAPGSNPVRAYEFILGGEHSVHSNTRIDV
jgi:hypothetical protein